jgi:hypothetical protein
MAFLRSGLELLFDIHPRISAGFEEVIAADHVDKK